MKPLSQHIQETLNNESLKQVLIENLVDEELRDLKRVAPANKVSKGSETSFVDKMVGGK